MYRILFDTNALLDAVCPNRPEQQEVHRLLARCNGDGDMGIACGVSLKDVYYVMSRRFDEPTARKAVEWLCDLLVIGPVSAKECTEALLSNEPDFEDGLIRACAELNDVDFIISRDSKAFAGSPVRRVSAKEYLRCVVQTDEARLGYIWS
ncbi:MAG: PIN domain-containing protein [Coriobacteriales bacterium]|nr:PIN domain-containing protein [Coriobacteriales bacterium]